MRILRIQASEQLSAPASHRPDASLIPFARTRQEREAAGDPRPSIAERYGSRAAYIVKIKAAAAAFVAERLLLPADAYVEAADACDWL